MKETLCSNDSQHTEKVSTENCFNHAQAKLRYEFWNIKNYFRKLQATHKSEFTEYV
jgi:hypothetical protein